MKCPYCGNQCPDEALYCDVCKQLLPTTEKSEDKSARRKRTPVQITLIVLAWVLGLSVLFVGVYKLFSWIESYNLTRLYTRGAYTPTVNEYKTSDGRNGHAFVFYGEDGDMVFLPEMNRSLSICGGVARLEIPDSDWFGDAADEYQYADVTFAPLLIKKGGQEISLPVLKERIEVPESPLTVLTPSSTDVKTVTSTYEVELQIVPGSSIFINGENLTDRVDRSGYLDLTVGVEPIGDNVYTVIVRTPKHKESRNDIVIYREAYDIDIELDKGVATQSTETTMAISGTCEPGASITVDTEYIEESYQIDMTTGRFSFIAKFTQLGDNVVRFRATKEGRKDAVISFTVYYKPTLAQYSAKAWRMDYPQLKLYYESWLERVFKCVGPIIDKFDENGVELLVMDVSEDGASGDYIFLQNMTTISPSLGPSYTAWADVVGRHYYKDHYYPMLTARYMDLTSSE